MRIPMIGPEQINNLYISMFSILAQKLNDFYAISGGGKRLLKPPSNECIIVWWIMDCLWMTFQFEHKPYHFGLQDRQPHGPAIGGYVIQQT